MILRRQASDHWKLRQRELRPTLTAFPFNPDYQGDKLITSSQQTRTCIHAAKLIKTFLIIHMTQQQKIRTFKSTEIPAINIFSLRVWAKMDSNHRRYKPADLQSAPFGHSGIRPQKLRFGHRQQPSRLFQRCKGKQFFAITQIFAVKTHDAENNIL